MKTATLNWTLPTTRTSGGALDVSEIARVDIYMSADAGANFVLAGNRVPTEAQEFIVSDLDVGTYTFRVVVVDTSDRPSLPSDVDAIVPDESPPSQVADLTVTLA